MSNIQVFRNEQFGEVRTIVKDGEPWFVAADVCKALELDRTAVRRLDEDEKGVHSTHTLGGEQQIGVVSEAGLYTLVLGSRHADAVQHGARADGAERAHYKQPGRQRSHNADHPCDRKGTAIFYKQNLERSSTV